MGDDLSDNDAADSDDNNEEEEVSIELSFDWKKTHLNLNNWWESKTIIQLSNSYFEC